MKKILILTIFLLQIAPTYACEISNELEISALYPNPIEDESEWIEITNIGSESLDLSNYSLQDATEKPFTLSGTLLAEESKQISNLPFQLNNSSETITLLTIDEEILDSFSYESSTAGEIIYTNQNNEEKIELEEEEPITSSIWPEFSEALPNPEGADSSEEWIELYNPYSESISLLGFYLDDQDGGSTPYALENEIFAESYLLISIEDSKITLNNTTDSIRLLDSEKNEIWEIEYDGPNEGETYALLGSAYDWTTNPTPGSANAYGSTDTNSEYQNGDLSEDVVLTEVYPDPKGPDQDNEWIEITNGGDDTVNLGNWTVDDGQGGSNAYTFPDDIYIEPGETLVLYRSESEIALNNSNESIQLSDYTGEIVDEIKYTSSEEGQSYSKIEIEDISSEQASLAGLAQSSNSTWKWVQPSPGEPNPIWKQIQGKVISFENNTLTLNNGLNNWIIKVPENSLYELIIQTGNTLLVQASQNDGTLALMTTELIEADSPPNTANIPWGFITSILLGSIWIANQVYKSHKTSVAF